MVLNVNAKTFVSNEKLSVVYTPMEQANNCIPGDIREGRNGKNVYKCVQNVSKYGNPYNFWRNINPKCYSSSIASKAITVSCKICDNSKCIKNNHIYYYDIIDYNNPYAMQYLPSNLI